MSDVEELSKEIKKLKARIEALSGSPRSIDETSLAALIKYLVEERARTNRELASLAEQVKKLEELVIAEPKEEAEESISEGISQAYEEVPLSGVDAKVIEFVQTKGMVSAKELQEYMHYKGKNAASARLNSLYKRGILQKYQMGHKVYYRYAGKANQILITPPQ